VLEIARRGNSAPASHGGPTSPTAQAADPGFCRGYAAAAIRQVRGALNHARCLPALQGARWSADFNVHHNRRLGVTHAQAGSERDGRTAYLRGCAM
jgi:hypothetical protein